MSAAGDTTKGLLDQSVKDGDTLTVTLEDGGRGTGTAVSAKHVGDGWYLLTSITGPMLFHWSQVASITFEDY